MASKFSVEAIFKAIDEVSAPITKIESRMLSLSKNTRQTLGDFDSFNGKIHSGLMTVAKGAAAAAVAAGTVAYHIGRTGIDFEQAITNVGAVSLMTRKQVKDLEVAARDLGTTTKFSAIEVAGGMELMGKAGFTNQQILAGIGPILSAAAAEGADFAEVASVMSNTLNGMGLQKTAKDTQMVADVLTLASARTNSSITSLGESMKNLAPLARQFNVPFKDAVASVALLQDVGIDASEAGTSMATMLTKLATPTEAIKGKMRALGVEFQDAKGNMLELPAVFANFSKAAEKSGGNMKQAAFFAELVGLRGQRAALNMQQMFKSGRFKELADELERAEGKAKEMADLRMNTLGGDLTVLSNTVDDLKISLFDMNSGPLREIVQDTTAWIKANKGLVLTKVQDFIAGVVKHMPEIVKWAKRIAIGAGAFYTFAGAVKIAKTGLEAYELSVQGVAMATKMWRATMLTSRFAIVEATAAVRVLNAESAAWQASQAAGQASMSGWRTALNASGLAQSINGVTSSLGKAGLLGAALAVGYAFGSWLNTTFKLDEKIADIAAKLTGLDKKMAGRDAERGLKPGDPRQTADGTVVSADGRTVLEYGADAARIGKQVAKANFLANESERSRMRMNPAMRRAFRQQQDMLHADEDNALRRAMEEDMGIVTPQERIARSISESTENTKAEIVIRDQSGRAEVTQKPTSPRIGIKLEATGAFQ